MGGQRFDRRRRRVFEPADPARTMPKWLVIGAIVAVIVLVVVMSWLNHRSLEPDDEPAATNTPAPAATLRRPTQPAAPPPARDRGQGRSC